MERAKNKASRLIQIENLLLAHPEGLSQAEIARRLNVDRSTINRYIADLPKHIYLDDLDGYKFKLDRTADLINVRLNLHEALAVHLAARLLATRMDRQNPHAASALRKIGVAMQRWAERISLHVLKSADVMDEAAQRKDPGYLRALEQLTLGWAAQRKVRVWHYSEKADKVFEYLLSPYFIEPYAVGQTTHVIGLSEPPGKLRTLKIERIERAEPTQAPYEIPADFDPRELLANAWGVWYTENPSVEVMLKFHPRVAGRVRETRWHRSEEESEQPDGSILWKSSVAEPQEMIPWIRGWGADCEVLAPEELREALEKEVRRLVRVYGVGEVKSKDDSMTSKLLRLWGKTERNSTDPEAFHPVMFHILDVGNVARELLSEKASPRWRKVMGKAIGADANTLVKWLPWFVAMHDIGKISAPFQQANDGQSKRLEREGFDFGNRKWNNNPYHAIVSAVFAEAKEDQLDLPEALRQAWRDALAAHHGEFSGKEARQETRYLLQAEPKDWAELRQRATQVLKNALLQRLPDPIPTPPNLSAAAMALTGFIVLCDWIGSDEKIFQPVATDTWQDYASESASRAKRAIKAAGFFQVSLSNAPTTFSELFPSLSRPRPLQLAIDDIPDNVLSAPCLAIIEAPTGEGKTEAAWALAHRLAKMNESDELYYALPTTATSNQMFGRFQKYVEDRLALSSGVRLVHGQAFLLDDDFLVTPLQNGKERNSASDWFGSDKRKSLLAPFGVGTIDQAELAALNVRFTVLRLIGLAGKVVILDEVHAYDTYMTTIIERLLSWLSVLGTSVILLSATLPSSRREALIRAYSVESSSDDKDPLAYPKICVVGRTDPHYDTPPAIQPDRKISVHHLHLNDDDADAKARWLLDKIADGGCACWITNTVDRAQKIFKQVDRLASSEVERMLIHARFPLDNRQALETKLTEKYGPDGKRSAKWKGIVIGTQVLEQSLDLDFDVMASDLAPVDFLLQRAGRLQRHAHHIRPAMHEQPCLWINVPLNDDKSPSIAVDVLIYDEYILRQTWSVLNGRDEINLPTDYRPLVEAVYNDSEPAPDSPIREVWKKLKGKEDKSRGLARERLLPQPDPDDTLSGQLARFTFEESESKANWFIAQTRLGDESLTIIPLERAENLARLWLGEEVIPLDAEAPRPIQKRLMRRSIRTGNRYLIAALKAQEAQRPRLFTESSLLKECYPLWLVDGKTEIPLAKGKLSVTLHATLGLIIEKEENE